MYQSQFYGPYTQVPIKQLTSCQNAIDKIDRKLQEGQKQYFDGSSPNFWRKPNSSNTDFCFHFTVGFFRRLFHSKSNEVVCVFSSFSNGLTTSCENFSPFMVCWHFRALLPTLKNLFVLKKGQNWFEFEIPSLIVISSPCQSTLFRNYSYFI